MNAHIFDCEGILSMRRASVALGGAVLCAVLIAAPSFAAEETPPPPPSDDLTTQYVDLDQIAPEVSGSAVTVYLTGSAPKLPEGTVIEARLTLHSAEVDKTTIKLDGSRRFTKFPFKIGNRVVFGDGYCLQLLVTYADQTPKVQEALRALAPKIFRGPFSQWSWIYFDRPFRLGTAADQSAQLEETRAFFKDLLLQAIKLNNEFAKEVGEATEGTKYVTNGKLDSDAWRKWLDGTWRKSVLGVQQKLQKWQEANGALLTTHNEGVTAAWRLLEMVARRSALESRELYRAYKLETHEHDVSVPPGLEGLRFGSFRGAGSPRAIARLRTQLGEEYDRVIDSFRLDLPKVKKAPEPAKEEPAAEPEEPAKKAEAPAPGKKGT